MNNHIIEIARMKACQSNCRYKISAVGFNHKGEMICSSFNKKRFYRKGGGIHAEMGLMSDYGKYLKTILISRVNNNGEFLPIDPCSICKAKADELGIKIITIKNIGGTV